MSPQVDPAAAQAAADFNAAHPVGTVVDYWRGVREGAPSGRGATNGRAGVLSGHTAVIWIDGCSGAIALTHVRVVEPSPAIEGPDARSELTADQCEEIFHAALSAGDARGAEAALTVMAVRDPHRAQELLDLTRVALHLAVSR
jgi:hypothetical protein